MRAGGVIQGAVQLEAAMHLRTAEANAFENLMRQSAGMVLRVALRLTGDLSDAQDVSQEVFLKLHRELPKIESGIQAWLYRVTVNACWDLRRKRARSPVVIGGESVMGTASREANPEQRAAARQEQALLEEALSSLGERERSAIVLREMEGLSTAEVAAVFGSSETTVRVHISTARVKLREYFRKAREKRS
jgi:RNA polymerase sigma-70 factor (ECF subfamily)